MKKIIIICVATFATMTWSCVKNSSEYKALQAQRDSLALVNARSMDDLDQFLSLLNEVEDNFNSIKAAENYLTVQSGSSGELTPSTRERIQNDMKFVTETLDKNRQQIADLEARLKKSNRNSSELNKMLKNLQNELEEKTSILANLSEELAKRDLEIAELNTHVAALSRDVDALRTQSDAQQETISQQQSELNTVYYCFGTSKELKEQNILVKNQLGTNFNKDFFIKVQDFKQLKVVSLYAKKGQLISKHPEGTYEFGKDANNQAELKIVDPKNFWSLTKYMVIQVNI